VILAWTRGFGRKGVRVLGLVVLIHCAAVGCTKREVVTASQLQGGIVGSGAWTRDELYFGLGLPSGEVISDSAFNEFVNREVLARFPDGFTLMTGTGYYRGSADQQTVREPTRVLIILYRDIEREKAQAFGELAGVYRRMFNQQSVLRVTSRVIASF
jgi:hypothetical protein